MIPAHKENYRFYLNDVRWQLKRKEILKRDKVCQKCGNDRNLDVHHTYYVTGAMPWEYENEYIIVLCRNCHDSEHNDIKQLKDVIEEMLKMNLWASEVKEIITSKLNAK